MKHLLLGALAALGLVGAARAETFQLAACKGQVSIFADAQNPAGATSYLFTNQQNGLIAAVIVTASVSQPVLAFAEPNRVVIRLPVSQLPTLQAMWAAENLTLVVSVDYEKTAAGALQLTSFRITQRRTTGSPCTDSSP